MPSIKNADMRGQLFSQDGLRADLGEMIAGQKPWAKAMLLLLSGGLSLAAGLLAGWLGGVIGADLMVGEPIDRWQSIVTFPLLIIWLVAATFISFSFSLCVAGAGGATIALMLWGGVFPLSASESRPMYIIALIFVAIALISFSCIRFALALAAIISDKSKPFHAVGILSLVVSAALITVNNIIWVTQSGPVYDEPVLADMQRRFIENITINKWVMLAVTLLLSLSIATGAWYANYRRRVPWRHPDFLRSLALSIGSWQGTSFRNLDLSGINLSGTRLANCDLRAWKLHRTNLQGVTGLRRASVDSRYLDLELPKVQKLLTQGGAEETDYNRLNLQGAFLKGGDLRRFQFVDTNLNGADLSEADLRGAILARTQVIGTDFSHANLSGICIKDWSVNEQTLFTNVLCEYVYRDLDGKNEPIDRYPADRNFEPQEFESLYQEIGNVAELIFKEGVNWRAFSFGMQKLELEEEGLGLELKGFERRGDRWVVRVTHNQDVSKQAVESRLLGMYDEMKGLLAAKENQINQLLGIASDQAESIKELSQKPFGNSFFINGSTITNLTGSGNIEYTEAAHQVREIITYGGDRKQAEPLIQQLGQQLRQQDVAETSAEQLELMQQLIVSEAKADPNFQDYLLKESQHITQVMAGAPLSDVIQRAVQVLTAPQ